MDKMRRPLIAVSLVILAVAIISVCWAVWLRMGDSVLDHRIANTLYYPFVGMGYGLLFFLVVLFPMLKKIASLKPVVFIGTISYSIYLWHVFALKLFSGISSGMAGFLITLIATLVISAVSYQFVERTFLKLKAQ